MTCVCLLVCVSMCMNVYVSVLKVCVGVSNTLQCILHMTVQSSVEVCIEVCSVHFLFCFCCCFLQVLFLLFLLFGLGLGHPVNVIFHLKTFYWAWLVNNTIVYCSDLKMLKLQKGKYFHCSEDTVVYLIFPFFSLFFSSPSVAPDWATTHSPPHPSILPHYNLFFSFIW